MKVTMKTRLTRKEFDDTELTESAFKIYSNSSFCFWVDTNGNYFWSDSPHDYKNYLGTIQDVNEFLESWAEGNDDE